MLEATDRLLTTVATLPEGPGKLLTTWAACSVGGVREAANNNGCLSRADLGNPGGFISFCTHIP